MKNLLYTFLLGLVIISCEKDDKGDYNSLVVPSQEVAAKDFESADLLSQLISDINSGVVETTKKLPSTAKIGGNDEDYLLGRLFTDGTNTYFVYSTESNTTDWCVPAENASAYPDRYYDNLDNGNSIISVKLASDLSEITQIPGKWEDLFDLDFTVAYRLDADLKITGIGSVNGAIITF